MSALQPPTCHFLRIPRELRNEIYAYYLSYDGYHHYPESNTLRYNDGTAIDLALVSSCKQVESEMAELPLKFNTVSFKTHLAHVSGVRGVPGGSPWFMAQYLHSEFSQLADLKLDACVIAFAAFGNGETACRILKQYPQSGVGPALQRILQTKGPYHDIANTTVTRLFETTHMDHQAIQDTLQYLSSHCGLPNWLKSWSLAGWLTYISGWIDNWGRAMRQETPQVRRNALEIVSSSVSSNIWLPWVRPTTVHIKEMRELGEFLTATKRLHINRGMNEIKYYESATSQCIHFLGMLQHKERSRLRHLVIREDRGSSASPRCHAHGLIPYLKDLPRLRVDHRVDMWNAIFVRCRDIIDQPFARTGVITCSLSHATHKTIYWINEALDLRHAGMPSSVYRLHLEAPIDIAQHVWSTIKSLAAWCLANARYHHQVREASITDTGIANKDLELEYGIYQERVLVSNVRLLLSGDPTVQLSCPIGTLEEFEEEASRISHELMGQTREAWRRYGNSLLRGDLNASEYDFRATQELYADYLG